MAAKTITPAEFDALVKTVRAKREAVVDTNSRMAGYAMYCWENNQPLGDGFASLVAMHNRAKAEWDAALDALRSAPK